MIPHPLLPLGLDPNPNPTSTPSGRGGGVELGLPYTPFHGVVCSGACTVFAAFSTSACPPKQANVFLHLCFVVSWSKVPELNSWYTYMLMSSGVENSYYQFHDLPNIAEC